MATTTFLAPTRGAMPRLRIALLAPPWVPVPPPTYGGIEQVVAALGAGLVERGHEVVLVAAAGSELPGGEVVSPLAELPGIIGEPAADWRHALAGIDALSDVDVVIDHSGPLGALLTSRLAVPGLHVTHGPLTAVPVEIYEGIARHFPRLRLVAISEAQRASAPTLPFAGVRHNGLDLGPVPFGARPDGHLAFLGRMSPEKGARDAARIARAAGVELKIAAKCREPAERQYFDEHVKPYLGGGIEYIGELDHAEKGVLLRDARALLAPIDWEEPFGLVFAEAAACGTPVVATRRGSVPEVVVDGVTGIVRATPEELVTALPLVDSLDRVAIRLHAERQFAPARMVSDYLDAYALVLEGVDRIALSA